MLKKLINFFRTLIFGEVKTSDEPDDILTHDAIHRSLGSFQPPAGHKIFSYDYRTKSITEVKPELIEGRGPKGEKIIKKKIMYEKGMLYVHALNFKNAVSRVNKGQFIMPKN